jgi:hypothetical protein
MGGWGLDLGLRPEVALPCKRQMADGRWPVQGPAGGRQAEAGTDRQRQAEAGRGRQRQAEAGWRACGVRCNGHKDRNTGMVSADRQTNR